MKIIPKFVGSVKEFALIEGIDIKRNPDDNTTTFQITQNPDKPIQQQVEDLGAVKKIVPDLEKGDTMSVVEPTNEAHITEYKNPNATRYTTWIDVFTKGVQDETWLRSLYLQKDIFSLAENVPFTNKDLSIIEKVYEDPDFITQQVIGGVGVILKNALARRSPLPEDIKTRLRSFDTMLSVNARKKGLVKKKNLERTMDVNLKAHYLKLQNRDSWAEARGNIMGLPENQTVISIILKNEINKILGGGEPDLDVKKEIFNLIWKQSDTKTKIKNRGEEAQPKDYVPVNLLILYAVLVKDVGLVKTAIEAEGQEIDPGEQKRIKGKFAPKLGTMLAGLVEHEEMSVIRDILKSANLIPKSKIIKPKIENRNMGKTIIISERQAQMLSLLRLSEYNLPTKVTKDTLGYETPKNGDYLAEPATGTDYAKELENKRKSRTGKFTHQDYKSLNNKKKSLIVDEKLEETKKQLNDYLVNEGVEYYKITTKKDLLEQLLKK